MSIKKGIPEAYHDRDHPRMFDFFDLPNSFSDKGQSKKTKSIGGAHHNNFYEIKPR